MNASTQSRMTSDEFIRWAMEQPDGKRFELVAGRIIDMAPERVGHTRVKQRVFQSLAAGIAAAGIDCEAFVDGMAVQVDEATIYQPDALVRCGPPLADETNKIVDPLIIVEVTSPSSRARDTGAKRADYFRILSVRHYLILTADTRTIVHHRRDETGAIQTRIVRDNRLRLDPPGIDLDRIFPDAAPE